MKKQIGLIIGISGVLVICMAPMVSLLLLNSNWLQEKLVAKANEQLEADLTITSLNFSPFQGKATLGGLAFSRQDEANEVNMTLQSAELDVAVWPLLYRSVQIKRLELLSPQVSTIFHQLPAPDAEEEQPPSKTPSGTPRPDFRIATLIVHNGAIDLTVLREDRPPIHTNVTHIDYEAHDITLQSYYGLLAGSDLQCQIEMGHTASLKKVGSTTPSTFTLTDLDLGEISTFVEQTQALRVEDGLMDVAYTADADQIRARVMLKQLQLVPNPEASKPTLFFIPTDTILTYVEERDGEITLEFTLDEKVRTSEDLHFILNQFWEGLLTAALEKIKEEGVVDTLLEQGKQKALDFLRNKTDEP